MHAGRVRPMWITLCAILMMTWTFATIDTDAATNDSNTTTVTASVAEAIEVTSWPATTFSLTAGAVPGQEVLSEGLNFDVRANTAWGIQVSADDVGGKLREFDTTTSQYVSSGHVVTNSVQWGLSATGPWTNLSDTPTTLFSNQAATGEAGASVAFLLRYMPTFDDIPLTNASHEYRIALTYTAAVGY